ncbi:MAG: peptidoglycan bridge formation glycyltransferase FemA/FemB family protein [Anaerolineae bacterium]|nr:peptidoglycan bridge formation glycyltransferase FemA/FemB family protein [Anaerolineae bacterium]
MPLKLSNFSDAQWDQFVAGHPHGHVLQSSAWGAFKARHGWRPLRVALADETGQPMAGAQLLLRQMPLATVAYCPRGPVARPADLGVLLPHVHAAARRAGAVFLKVEPAWEGDHSDVWRAQGFNVAQTVQPPSTIVLDLTQTEEQLLATMKQKWRYNIRLAAKKGVVVREATEADLPAWYALMEVTGVRDGFGIHAADYYTDAFRLFCDGQRGVLLIAEFAGEMLGGVMIFAFGPEAIYMYGASGNAYRNLMPNHALQWAAIRWAKARGCARYDFWGIPPEATEDEGPTEDGRRKTEREKTTSICPPSVHRPPSSVPLRFWTG